MYFSIDHKRVLLIILLSIQIHTVFSQSDSTGWFPQKSLFPLLEYDLLEVQPFIGVFKMYASDVDYEGVYIPINLGFRKTLVRWNMLSMQFDLAMGVASYSQFEIIRFDRKTLRGGLLNTDFKGSGFLFAKKGKHRFRLQVFHISSHLGDDYMLRNQYFELNDKTVNYEQLDITYLFRIDNTDLYVGVGEVITPNAFRERFMLELGIQAFPTINPKQDLLIGMDIKFYEENSFNPDIHSGIGINFKNGSGSHLNISADLYYGSLPYSTLDFGRVFWIGLSTKIYL